MQSDIKPARRPRFRRADSPPAFRLTEDDVELVRLLARHRFLRSTHLAGLAGRSLDRTNDRLAKLFHAGYVDRPRAQLDYYPNRGSGPMVYALGDKGVKLLSKSGLSFTNLEWSRKNREAGRPFIDHQLEIMDFYVGVQIAAAARSNLTVIHPDELVAAFPDQVFSATNPFALQTRINHHGVMLNVGIVPDLVFGLRFADGSKRCFMVEIDRGTMPITRSNLMQTSFERKMRAYLSAFAARQHERHFGWKNFRVLTVTTDENRISSMREVLSNLHVSQSPGAGLFFFASRPQLHAADALLHVWRDGAGRRMSII